MGVRFGATTSFKGTLAKQMSFNYLLFQEFPKYNTLTFNKQFKYALGNMGMLEGSTLQFFSMI